MTKHDIDKHVGKRVKQRRTMLGLSQEAIATGVGLTFQQIQKYEKGSNAMSSSRLFDFSRFMSVPVSYFFEGLDENNTSAGAGFAENIAMAFEHDADNENAASERETLEVMKAFSRIDDPMLRKRFADLIRSVADTKTVVDA